jgi:flagellar biosynthesis/type III secretory pathway M-ring protein FliF/YscJ
MAEFVVSPNRLWAIFRSQRRAVRILWVGVVMLGTIVLANLVTAQRQPDYAPLYAHLSDRDGGAILQALDKLSMPYKVVGGVIQIPAQDVEVTRYRLAAQGLPKGDDSGYDMMATPSLGMSSFQEQIGYQHALEADLSHTLESIAPVASARVHLAIPKASAFLRAGSQPSAAVLIKTKPGMTLDEEQVQAIRQIIASGVPRMAIAQVGIVNEQGELLARAEDSGQNLSPDERQTVHSTEVELVNRIMDVLTPWLGRGNVRAQVTPRLNFSEMETTRERARSNSKGLDRTVETRREPSGRIERLSALVVVNEASLPENERHDPATQKKIERLASEAMGMESGRRDSLQVVLLPFGQLGPRTSGPPPLSAERPGVIAKAKPSSTTAAIAVALLALIGLTTLWLMNRRRGMGAVEESQEEATSPFDAAVDAARKSVLDNPARAASVLRLWLQSP